MTANQLMFILLSMFIVVCSVLTVTSRRILRAAIFLLFVLISTSGIYFMLNFQFLAAVQLTLYAGGIVVLIIFSILLTSHISQRFEPIGLKKSIFSALAVVGGLIITIITILDFKFSATTEAAKEVTMRVVGTDLLSTGSNGYILPFEVVSILLLASMVAAIVVAKKAGPSGNESENPIQ
jgi:NADH-quinone oxidoreductase subunit J